MRVRPVFEKPTRKAALALMLASLCLPSAGHAQFSPSYNFLKAVRDRDGAKVTEQVDKPGSTVINTKDYATGETALHIVVAGRDSQWLAFLLAKGANPNARNRDGQTPLAIAATLGWVEGARLLLTQGADVDASNDRGETPLILAVQRRDIVMVKLLLSGGANPKLPDHVAGMSARDYATQDARGAMILRAIDEAGPVKAPAPVQGPRLP